MNRFGVPPVCTGNVLEDLRCFVVKVRDAERAACRRKQQATWRAHFTSRTVTRTKANAVKQAPDKTMRSLRESKAEKAVFSGAEVFRVLNKCWDEVHFLEESNEYKDEDLLEFWQAPATSD